MWVLKQTDTWSTGKTTDFFLKIPGVSTADTTDPGIKKFRLKSSAINYAREQRLRPEFKPARLSDQ